MGPSVAIAFGIGCQVALLAFFAAFHWRPARAEGIGVIVYALGVPAAVLAVAYLVLGPAWPWALALLLYAAWAATGAWLDTIRRIPWRSPPRWRILVPYALLLTASLLAFWVPLWWIDRGVWVAFGALYAAHTTLNAMAHRGSSGSGAAPSH
jgi:hypothetical protein